jgi:flagellar hook-basal body complex protein FliE
VRINQFVPDNKIFESVNVANKTEDKKNTSFFDTLMEKLDEINDKQIQADNVTEQFVKGEGPDIQDVMLSTEEAKMSLELAVQIRNKIVDAYQEINRMQL